MTVGKRNQKEEEKQEKIFSVPFALGEIKENISISTNNPSKPSKEQIINKAFKFHSQGNISEAAKYYQYCISQGFNDHRIFSNYGLILRTLGKFHKAELSTRKAIELKPDFADAYSNLGGILKDLGKFHEAELSTRKAIELKPDFADAYSNLGGILKDLGKLQEAALSMRKAIELKPDFAIAYSNLGIILNDLGKFKEAKIEWIKAIELDPKSEKANSLLAEKLYLEKKYELAINYIKGKNSHRSLSLYLGCLLCLDREKEFNKHYLEVSEKRICNAEVGSIIEHANAIYKNEYKSTFCHEAMKYVLWDKINEELFSENDCNQLISYIKDENTIMRSQTLLNEGIQTSGNLFTLDYPFIKSIKKALELKIELYKRKFKNSEQGFIKYWPEDYELRSWIISMKTGGYIKQHNHGYGWITGSYYLRLPKTNKNSDAGNISFSYEGPQYPSKGKSFISTIKKIETRDICIFPSSLFHRTIPFKSKEDRISFVFDLVEKQR